MIDMSTRSSRLEIYEKLSLAVERLGEQFSSGALSASPRTLSYACYMMGRQDRINMRGTFYVTLTVGYGKKKKRLKVVDGQIQIRTPSLDKKGVPEKDEKGKIIMVEKWIDVVTGLPEYKKEIQRSLEREMHKTMGRESMENKLAIATQIQASVAASKRAKKEKMRKLEKIRGLITEGEKEGGEKKSTPEKPQKKKK